MPDPTSLQVVVCNAVGAAIGGAKADVVIRRGTEFREEHNGLSAPATVPLRAGFIQIEVSVRAPEYVDERVLLTFRSADHRWDSTNPACTVTEAERAARLTVFAGRIRFAPIVMLPDDKRIVPPLFLPGAVLANPHGYRTINLELDERMRVLAPEATGDPNSPGWDRFRWNERTIKLAGRGNWLILEYGDPSGRPDAIRHLIGVWAPHSFAGVSPPIVVQVTPDTHAPFYPADSLPFTGAYPYGCVVPQDAVVDKQTKTVDLKSCRQAYVELPANRCLGQYKVVYQLYAARPDLFDGPNGPIVITPSPALISTGSLRAPFEHPDGMGRLIAEVLRFLYAHKLTLPMSSGGLRLRFRGTEITLSGERPVTRPIGIPQRTLTTVLCHSAGVVPVLNLARNMGRPDFPKNFPKALWGGRNPYCDENWTNLWVIDGVATPGGIGVPSPGGPAARTWVAWLRPSERRMVMVYTPSGSPGRVAPELVQKTTAPPGKTGRLEEGTGTRVRWLHMTYSYLKADPAQNPPNVRPAFGPPSDDAEKSHNKVYELGVGYAAGRPR